MYYRTHMYYRKKYAASRLQLLNAVANRHSENNSGIVKTAYFETLRGVNLVFTAVVNRRSEKAPKSGRNDRFW